MMINEEGLAEKYYIALSILADYEGIELDEANERIIEIYKEEGHSIEAIRYESEEMAILTEEAKKMNMKITDVSGETIH